MSNTLELKKKKYSFIKMNASIISSFPKRTLRYQSEFFDCKILFQKKDQSSHEMYYGVIASKKAVHKKAVYRNLAKRRTKSSYLKMFCDFHLLENQESLPCIQTSFVFYPKTPLISCDFTALCLEMKNLLQFTFEKRCSYAIH